MGEWMQRAALIQGASTATEVGIPDGNLLQRDSTASTTPDPDYRRYPDRYEFPCFVIRTTDGLVQFQLAVPRRKYDALAVLDLFVRHHGLDASGQEGAKVE
ncbi:hypothetical protein [Accumulibacter sp.]|uniref:hypothetical protein n=1 Tax=Accumulibacter sp. TaxID=2053492 RepID=UPI0025F4459C|nr:hypothetical protein [Accumulibacter sp.]MCM8626949.1 hypothetical protein [Accumulibacter sp.]